MIPPQHLNAIRAVLQQNDNGTADCCDGFCCPWPMRVHSRQLLQQLADRFDGCQLIGSKTAEMLQQSWHICSCPPQQRQLGIRDQFPVAQAALLQEAGQ